MDYSSIQSNTNNVIPKKCPYESYRKGMILIQPNKTNAN